MGSSGAPTIWPVSSPTHGPPYTTRPGRHIPRPVLQSCAIPPPRHWKIATKKVYIHAPSWGYMHVNSPGKEIDLESCHHRCKRCVTERVSSLKIPEDRGCDSGSHGAGEQVVFPLCLLQSPRGICTCNPERLGEARGMNESTRLPRTCHTGREVEDPGGMLM